MKVPKKGKDKKKVNKKGAITKTKVKKEQVLVVAQEIKYARLLSGNEKNSRDRVLKALKKWLTNCFEKGYEFKEEDFSRIWKGLFYAMWMSDKPLIQEELCESISGILDLFPPDQLKAALLMVKAGFKTLATEWFGIDQHRMDKFLMLVRRYLRGSLRVLCASNWSLDSCERYAAMLSTNDGLFAPKTPHYARNATSMLLHFQDCYLEEVAKVSEGSIPEESVAALVQPFTKYTCLGEQPTLCVASRRLLTALLRQSEPALQYADKTRAWQHMGCPGDGPDALEPASDDDSQPEAPAASDDDDVYDDSSEKPLDPRAGRVDVSLPLLPVPAGLLAASLRQLLPRSASRAHKRVNICIQRFEKLACGENPLPVSGRLASPADGAVSVTVADRQRSVRALRALDTRAKSDADELKLRGLSRKHRKRLLKKTRAGLSIVEDLETPQHKKKQKNGEWLIESTDKAEDTSNKENQNKNKKNNKKRKFETQNGDVESKKVKLVEKNVKKEEERKKVKDSPNTLNKERESLKRDAKSKEGKLNGKIKEKNTNKIQKNIPDYPKVVIEKLKTYQKSLRKGREKKEAKIETVLTKNETKSTKNEPKLIKTEAKLIKKETNLTKNEPELIKTETKLNKNETILTKSETKLIKNVTKKKESKNNDSLIRTKSKKMEKQTKSFQMETQNDFDTPKKVKFVLKNNSMQKPVDYYKSVRQSPSIPFDGSKKPVKTNLKPSTPSPINPFFKKKNRMKQ